MRQAKPSCRELLMQEMPDAFCFALLSAGNSMAARMAMMAMTTSNSINVNAETSELDARRLLATLEINMIV